MASGKASKNARTSKKQEVMLPKRIKEKKKTILVEITKETYKKLKMGEDLSCLYDGISQKMIVDVITRYGKPYIKLLNE